MLAVQRSPPAPQHRLLPWSLPPMELGALASPEKPPSAAPPASPAAAGAPETLRRAPVPRSVIESWRAAPAHVLLEAGQEGPVALEAGIVERYHPDPSYTGADQPPASMANAADVAVQQLDAADERTLPASPPPTTSAPLLRKSAPDAFPSARILSELQDRPDAASREQITAAMAAEEHTQATYGRLGGMMSGLLGPNTFRADYAKGRRSRCKRCHTVFVAEEVRVGKVPPRVRADVPAVRVHWYHPACIFKSFELPRTVNGTGHTGPSRFCATSS